VVGPTVARFSDTSVEPLSNLGTMPRYFVGGNSGANCRQGATATPLSSGLQIHQRAAPAAGDVTFEVPGGWLQALLDAQAGTNPRVLRIWNSTVNQAMLVVIECAEVPLDYF
jgi:hypothetical protein